MSEDLLRAIADGNPKITIQCSAADLKAAILWMMETRPTIREERGVVTRKEAIRRYGVSSSTLWRWEKCGYLVPMRLGTKVVYEEDAIRKALDKKSDG